MQKNDVVSIRLQTPVQTDVYSTCGEALTWDYITIKLRISSQI